MRFLSGEDVGVVAAASAEKFDFDLADVSRQRFHVNLVPRAHMDYQVCLVPADLLDGFVSGRAQVATSLADDGRLGACGNFCCFLGGVRCLQCCLPKARGWRMVPPPRPHHRVLK